MSSGPSLWRTAVRCGSFSSSSNRSRGSGLAACLAGAVCLMSLLLDPPAAGRLRGCSLVTIYRIRVSFYWRDSGSFPRAGPPSATLLFPGLIWVRRRRCGGRQPRSRHFSGAERFILASAGALRTETSGSTWYLGFIPARAWASVALDAAGRQIRVHPRACGAAPSFAAPPAAGCGPSPRARGRYSEYTSKRDSPRCRRPPLPASRGTSPASARPPRCASHRAGSSPAGVAGRGVPRSRSSSRLRRPTRGS